MRRLRVTLGVDRSGRVSADPRLSSLLDRGKLKSPEKEDAATLRRGFARLSEPALAAATRERDKTLQALRKSTLAAITAERDARLEKLERAMTYQGVKPAARRVVLEEEQAVYSAMEAAVATLRFELDSVLGFVISK